MGTGWSHPGTLWSLPCGTCQVTAFTYVPRGQGLGEAWQVCASILRQLPKGVCSTDTPVCPSLVLYGSCSQGTSSAPGTAWALSVLSLSPPTHLQLGEQRPREAMCLVWGTQPRSSKATGTRTGLSHPLVLQFCKLFREPARMFIRNL